MSQTLHSAIARFGSIGTELCIGGDPLSLLAERVGSTPFYAYDRRILDSRVQELRAVLPASIAVHYAIKANPMPAVVGYMSARVDGLDVASAGELRVALDAGARPSHVSFAGPGKSDAELGQAVAAGVLVNVESARELPVLAVAARRLGRPARVAVRVNPDFELKSSGMKMGGGPKQFGIDAEQVPLALEEIGRLGLVFEGFHIFSGSQNLRAESICEAQTKAFELAVKLAASAPRPVRSLNLGGGFGIPYFPGEKPLELAPIGRHMGTLAAAASDRLPGSTLVIELGRFLVGEAGVYVARIIDKKVSRGEIFLVTDGGLHHHLAASGNFGQVLRKNYPVVIGNRLRSDRTELVSIVGPLCTPLDILADRVELPAAEPGDLVVVFQSGAYGFSASPHRFLAHPAPLEVLA